MLPLKISSFLNQPPLPQTPLGPARPRMGAAERPQLVPVAAAPPEIERRSATGRRVLERRESEQAPFLDTRIAQGRRRNPGRRAEDQQQRIAISIKA